MFRFIKTLRDKAVAVVGRIVSAVRGDRETIVAGFIQHMRQVLAAVPVILTLMCAATIAVVALVIVAGIVVASELVIGIRDFIRWTYGEARQGVMRAWRHHSRRWSRTYAVVSKRGPKVWWSNLATRSYLVARRYWATGRQFVRRYPEWFSGVREKSTAARTQVVARWRAIKIQADARISFVKLNWRRMLGKQEPLTLEGKVITADEANNTRGVAMAHLMCALVQARQQVRRPVVSS